MNVISPLIIENLSRTLARATAEGLRVSPRGGNSTQEKFLPPFDVDLNIDVTQLNRVIEYEPANLTITVEAGMTLAALQNVLREHGQFLPLDPPHAERATLGGILASNAYGPLRLRYGTARDWLIGLRAVLADGTVVRGGGKVVKNVAGYDLPKLFIGSHGTLGVIAEATFKLAPLPPFSRTLVAPFDTHLAALQAALPILRSTLLPSALELLDARTGAAALEREASTSCTLIAQFAGSRPAVERQTRELETLCRAQQSGALSALESADEQALWARIRDLPTSESDTLLCELRLLPSQLDDALTQLQSLAVQTGVDHAWLARAMQTLWVVLTGEPAPLAALVEQMRSWLAERSGYLIVPHMPAALKDMVDRWGPTRSDYIIMQRLKARFDPQSILNPGLFVGGL